MRNAPRRFDHLFAGRSRVEAEDSAARPTCVSPAAMISVRVHRVQSARRRRRRHVYLAPLGAGLGSKTTRSGLGPATRRVVSCGLSAATYRRQRPRHRESARMRCRWSMFSGPVTNCDSPVCIAMKPSRLWPRWPIAIRFHRRRAANRQVTSRAEPADRRPEGRRSSRCRAAR